MKENYCFVYTFNQEIENLSFDLILKTLNKEKFQEYCNAHLGEYRAFLIGEREQEKKVYFLIYGRLESFDPSLENAVAKIVSQAHSTEDFCVSVRNPKSFHHREKRARYAKVRSGLNHIFENTSPSLSRWEAIHGNVANLKEIWYRIVNSKPIDDNGLRPLSLYNTTTGSVRVPLGLSSRALEESVLVREIEELKKQQADLKNFCVQKFEQIERKVVPSRDNILQTANATTRTPAPDRGDRAPNAPNGGRGSDSDRSGKGRSQNEERINTTKEKPKITSPKQLKETDWESIKEYAGTYMSSKEGKKTKQGFIDFLSSETTSDKSTIVIDIPYNSIRKRVKGSKWPEVLEILEDKK